MAFFKKFRDAQRPCCAALVAAIPTGLVFWVCVQYHRAKAQRPSCKTEKPVL